jgi:hypothetical protein
MRISALTLILILGANARAEFVLAACTPDARNMDQRAGYIVKQEACNDHLCLMLENCFAVKKEIMHQYKTWEAIPELIRHANSFPIKWAADCVAAGEHCPSFQECISNDRKSPYNIYMGWDDRPIQSRQSPKAETIK